MSGGWLKYFVIVLWIIGMCVVLLMSMMFLMLVGVICVLCSVLWVGVSVCCMSGLMSDVNVLCEIVCVRCVLFDSVMLSVVLGVDDSVFFSMCM